MVIMMRRKDWIGYTGLWTQPILFAVMVYVFGIDIKYIITETYNFLSFLVLSFAPVLYIWSLNSTAKRQGKDRFGLLDVFNHNNDPYYQTSFKERAKYPVVADGLLSDKSEGIIFGRYQGKYVRKALGEDGHVFVIGGSGSGKSTGIVIPTLLCNSGVGVFAIDIKGELSYKTAKLGDENVIIFNPQDRSSYGYDPFYMLTSASTDQDIMECMQIVAVSLISLPANIKDPYWKLSARQLLTGLLIYYYKQGYKTLPDICSEILKKPIKDTVEGATNMADSGSVEMLFLGTFKGMADETLSGITSELTLHIIIFAADQNIRYAFKENPKKMNPRMLEEGKKIYLAIKEENLVTFYDVMQLLLNETLSELEKRPEASKPILFIIDELARILSQGKLEKLLDGVKTLRSRKVTLLMVTQSVEALLNAYEEAQVDDLIANCTYTVVLSASTMKTQDKIISWCGKFKERKTSYSGTAGKDRKRSISYEDKDIVEASNLITLPDSGELILISPKGYNRIKKAPYYKIPELSRHSESIIRHNDCIRELNSYQPKTETIDRLLLTKN